MESAASLAKPLAVIVSVVEKRMNRKNKFFIVRCGVQLISTKRVVEVEIKRLERTFTAKKILPGAKDSR